MTTLIALSFFIITTYIVYIIKVIGLRNLPSLSESYYTTKWKFQIALFSTAFLLVPVLLEITPEHFQFISFFTVAPILFVSVAPKFKNKDIERSVHIYSAKLSAISSLIWSSLMLKIMILPILLMILPIALVLNKKYNNKVFIGEIACFIIVYITIMITFRQNI